MIGMEPRTEAPALDFNFIHLDPITGQELGRATWGGLPHSMNDVMPFIYSLHMSLAAGEIGGWILGVVALIWTIDCFVAFYLTLPIPGKNASKGYLARWKTAWLVKWRASAYRINFDIHRAGGLWLWGMLLIFAWSSVSFDLNGFYTQVTKFFLDFDQPAWAQSFTQLPVDRAPLEWEQAQAIGVQLMAEQARREGFVIERPLALYILRDQGLFEYRVRSSLDIGDKAGQTSIIFDAYSGELRSVSLPTGQHSGNTLTTWLLELHTANLFGLPYRIFVCILGLAIATLSITGVYIWWKKRLARRKSLERASKTDIHLLSENA